MSPFHLVFGRERFVAGPPSAVEHECEGTHQYFDRMERLEKQVAEKLNATLTAEIDRANRTRRAPPTYQSGDWVWVLRPKSGMSAAKVETWWVGPVAIQRRTGENSYEVELQPGLPHMVHADRLKPFVVVEKVELFHFQTVGETEEATPREWNVEEIVGHRWVGGKPQFLTRWEGAAPGEETWEPVGNFVHRYSYLLPRYCKRKGINLDLVQFLSSEPLSVEK